MSSKIHPLLERVLGLARRTPREIEEEIARVEKAVAGKPVPSSSPAARNQ